jgi:hypothetical protein
MTKGLPMTALFSQDQSEVEAHELHKAGRPHGSANQRFQLGKSFRCDHFALENPHVRMANGRFKRGDYGFERFGRQDAQSLHSVCLADRRGLGLTED